jgi:hypothetical protein
MRGMAVLARAVLQRRMGKLKITGHIIVTIETQ